MLKWVIIGGDFSEEGGKPSGYVSKLSQFLNEAIPGGVVINGGSIDDLKSSYLSLGNSELKENNFDVEHFVTEDWLLKLDETVVLCGIPQYRNEVERFVETLENFLEVIGHVSVAKSRVEGHL